MPLPKLRRRQWVDGEHSEVGERSPLDLVGSQIGREGEAYRLLSERHPPIRGVDPGVVDEQVGSTEALERSLDGLGLM
jgi:hypothetical protein